VKISVNVMDARVPPSLVGFQGFDAAARFCAAHEKMRSFFRLQPVGRWPAPFAWQRRVSHQTCRGFRGDGGRPGAGCAGSRRPERGPCPSRQSTSTSASITELSRYTGRSAAASRKRWSAPKCGASQACSAPTINCRSPAARTCDSHVLAVLPVFQQSRR
jgi:hypothetical protein